MAQPLGERPGSWRPGRRPARTPGEVTGSTLPNLHKQTRILLRAWCTPYRPDGFHFWSEPLLKKAMEEMPSFSALRDNL